MVVGINVSRSNRNSKYELTAKCRKSGLLLYELQLRQDEATAQKRKRKGKAVTPFRFRGGVRSAVVLLRRDFSATNVEYSTVAKFSWKVLGQPASQPKGRIIAHFAASLFTARN